MHCDYSTMPSETIPLLNKKHWQWYMPCINFSITSLATNLCFMSSYGFDLLIQKPQVSNCIAQWLLLFMEFDILVVY